MKLIIPKNFGTLTIDDILNNNKYTTIDVYIKSKVNSDEMFYARKTEDDGPIFLKTLLEKGYILRGRQNNYSNVKLTFYKPESIDELYNCGFTFKQINEIMKIRNNKGD